MKVYGDLEAAKFEVFNGSDPAATATSIGRVIFRDDLKIAKVQVDASNWAGIGSGGAGGGFAWNEPQGISPIQGELQGEKIYSFESGQSNYLVAALKVPSSYVPGSQIGLNIVHYCSGTGGTMLLRTVTTLIRKDTDAVSSTTNQHTSVNTAISNTVTDQYKEAVVDLMDSAGEINSVAVSAGDVLLVRLERGTDTLAQDVNFLPSATEVVTL